jgi:putative heme-binding domain-containing protein
MRCAGRLFMLFSVSMAVASLVAGQPPGGGPQPGFGKGKGKGNDFMTLLNNASVKDELKLTDQQLQQLPAAILKQLAGVLSEKQIQRLQQIYLQQRGNSALLESDIKKELNITSDQAQKIQAILDGQAKAQDDIFQAGGFDFEKVQQIQDAATSKIQGVLSAEQKTAWNKLIGQPFDLKGGFGGGGGGGQKKGKQKAQASEEQLRADFKGPPGFDVTIFAKPPDANYPTCLYPLPNGEIFIGSDQEGSLGKTPKMGRVIRARDTKGTGKADAYNIFCEIDHPRGIIYDDGTMWICHPPDMSVFYDDTRSGKANRSELLVKGISSEKAVKSRGADHTTNNIRLAIDGWIYIAVGDFGMINGEATKDGAKITMRGGIARIRPDGTGLEQVTWGSRNVYDVAIDPYMNLFCRDNTNDGRGWDTRFHHMIPTATNGYPTLFVNFADETNQPVYDFGGGGPTGALFTDEPLLPKPYDSALFLVEWGKKVINRAFIEPFGASFKIGKEKKQDDFVRCDRPTVIDTDGAGRLYVGSWYGGQFNYAGPYIGYVAQMTPKDFKPTPFPDLKKATDAELISYVTAPGGTLRLRAQREMLRRGDKQMFAKGLEKFAGSDGLLAGRVAAIFTLKLLQGEKSHPALVRLASNATVREFALKALADDKQKTAGVPVELFVNALEDPDPRVRLQAVIGLGRLGKKDVADKLIPVLADPDPSVAHVAYRNLHLLGASETCLKALDASSPDAVILGSVFALQLMHEPAVVDGLIQKLRQAKDSRVRQAVIRGLARLHSDEQPYDGTWWGTQPNTKGPYYKPVKWAESDKIAEALSRTVAEADAATLAYLLQEVNKGAVPFKDKNNLIVKVAVSEAKYRPQAVDILAGQDDLNSEAIALLNKIVVDGSGVTAASRAKALRGLAAAAFKQKNLDGVVPTLVALGKTDLPVALAAARNDFINDGRGVDYVDYFGKLTQGNDAAAFDIAYPVLLQVAGNGLLAPAPRKQAEKYLDAAWSRPAATVSLLKAIGDSQAEEFGAQVKQRLNDPKAEIKDAARYAADLIDFDGLEKSRTGPTIGKLAYDEVLAASLKETGDARRGSKLFLKQGCVLCHTVSALDTPKGPPLNEAGSRYKRDELIESILKPSAKIAQGFETRFFLLNNGKMLEGFVTRDTANEIEIRDLAGVATVIPKSDIDQSGRRETSMMPERLVDGLTVKEFASLVAYLESLRKK